MKMVKKPVQVSPHRVSDLVGLKEKGAIVTCRPSFDVIPVDFQQRDKAYQAHIFLCRFSGEVDGEGYSFRKCYARGCSHNLCPHVSQAVMIANRYLQRDYARLKQVGMEIEERLFTLEDMLVKFEGYRDERAPALTIDDVIQLARDGSAVRVDIRPEYVPAVEHFSNYQNAQTFLTAHFIVGLLGRTHSVERCVACYATEKEREEKEQMVRVANARLEKLYQDFDTAAIKYEKQFFA
jgi:hypothetical protein